jgi:Putative beta-barrel porin-2, OmpL-like. bbp2
MRSLERTCAGEWLDRHKIAVYGWSDLSFTASTARGNQLPMGFNYEANQFLLQQNWLRVERAIDTGAEHPTYGFRLDTILPGSDYRFTIARGLWDSQLTNNNGRPWRYGIDPVQFYGEAYLPGVGKGLDVKLGRFFAQFGAESIDTTQNYFVSRSYTFIYNPFTHTGLLTTLKLNDTWSVQNGLATGCDVFIDPVVNPTYIGSVKWAPPDDHASALLSVIICSGRFDREQDFHNPQIFDLVLARKLTDKAKWTFEGLYGFTTRVPGIGFANWFGLVNYLTHQLTDTLSATGRLEFFDDCQGQRTGTAGLYTAATAGVTWKPHKWLVVRPEVRFDYNNGRPFNGQRELFTAALDVILRW